MNQNQYRVAQLGDMDIYVVQQFVKRRFRQQWFWKVLTFTSYCGLGGTDYFTEFDNRDSAFTQLKKLELRDKEQHLRSACDGKPCWRIAV